MAPACWLYFLFACVPVVAQQHTPAGPDSAVAGASGAVAAWVGKEPVLVADVDHHVRLLVRDRPANDPAVQGLRYQALQLLVDRQLVMEYLKRKDLLATQAEVDAALKAWKQRLEGRGISWQTWLEQQEWDEAGVRRWLTWQLSWHRYLDQYLTEENLRRFFEEHREWFDGTQRRVAHILLRVPSPQQLSQVREQARRIRQEIISGTLTFAEAARRYSQAPTAQDGGELGWIERYRPMPESFSRAAFQLEIGEVSEPVETAAGVHLIYVLSVKPGQRTWEQVVDEVIREATRFLFQWAADQMRSQVPVRFTGAIPDPDHPDPPPASSQDPP